MAKRNNHGKFMVIDLSDECYGCPLCGSLGHAFRRIHTKEATLFECNRCEGQYTVVLDGSPEAPYGFEPMGCKWATVQSHPYRRENAHVLIKPGSTEELLWVRRSA